VDLYLTEPVGPFAPAAGASFGTFTTRQDVSPLPVPVIPAGKLRIGSRIKIEAEGEYSSTGTPTIILGFYVGNTSHASTGAPGAIDTVLAETGTISLATAAAWPWRLEWRGLITAVGSSGTVVGQGDCETGTSLTAFTSVAIPTTQALRTVTISTVTLKAVGVCATFSASSASNTVKVNNMSVLILN
jgi:hypothetical protein